MKTAICCFGPAESMLYLLLIVFFTPKFKIEYFSYVNENNSSSTMLVLAVLLKTV